MRNQMDTALNISMQSSVQIALFVTPLLQHVLQLQPQLRLQQEEIDVLGDSGLVGVGVGELVDVRPVEAAPLAAVARTSTYALNNVTLPRALRIADLGWKEAMRTDPHLANLAKIARITPTTASSRSPAARTSTRPPRRSCSASRPRPRAMPARR